MRNYGETELLGRDPEPAMLREILETSHRSGGSTLVLRGTAGIGKSALLRLAETEARLRGRSVLSVTAVPAEAQLPYAGVGQLLGALPTRPGADLLGLLDDAAGRAAELGSAEPIISPPGGPTAARSMRAEPSVLSLARDYLANYTVPLAPFAGLRPGAGGRKVRAAGFYGTL